MIELTSFEELKSEELKLYSEFSEPQLARFFEPKPGLFIAESLLVTERAMDAGFEPWSFLLEKKMAEGEAKKLIGRFPDVPVYVASEDLLKTITGYPVTRGVLCAMKRKKEKVVEEILEGTKRIVLLEDVENPTNVGAIFRSAAALGIDAVLLSKGCADPLYRRAIRVSMGNVFSIPWTFSENWLADIEKLKNQGFQTIAMALKEDSVSMDDLRPEPEERVALLMGNEGAGLKEETISACHKTVMIPMANGVDSLNVAAASAVAFWQIRK
ncbi:MAG: RNA methyltransferase [Lachnospiraceae bacterium]|nr:RNA methyltransferase [Lachnospiraceae bacterium]